ncbi:MAG: MFS transporter, partial [Anaerolineales bacterium]
LVLVLVPPAYAHDGEASPIAGPLAWALMGFGVLVIAVVGAILFARQTGDSAVDATDFERLSGFSGYIGKMRLFSRNARLYMIHIVGMDVIFGTWNVVFNLYLLAVGMDVAFVGLRILISSVAGALVAIPAGLISDRIGRKLSFVLGDGVGALMSLIAISTLNPAVLLITGAIGGIFSGLHGVSEPAFMAENSEDYERVHLFSVSNGMRTAAAIIGSALAGLVPLIVLADQPEQLVVTYRYVAYFGIAGWFASLIPALLLTRKAEAVQPEARPGGLRALFSNVKHPRRIWHLTLPEVFVAMGAGFVLPLLNVFFDREIGSPAVEIGTTFAAGQAFLVVGSFLAPLVAARMGKVRSVVATRLLSVPFILLLGFSGQAGSLVGSVLSVAGFAYVMRITLMNMASPVRSAFGMEILDPGERGTQVGVEHALAGAVSGATAYIGAQLMDGGDFQTPFLLMAAAYLVGTYLFWQFFNGRERELSLAPAVAET